MSIVSEARDLVPVKLDGLAALIREKLPMSEGEVEIELVTRTVPEMRKTGNPYVGKVTKLVRSKAVVNRNYADEVNKRRVAKGLPPDFVPGPRKWGEDVAGTPLVEHKGRFYLVVIFDDEHKPDPPVYMVDGERADPERLKPFLVERDDDEFYKVYKLESIASLNIDGKTYEVWSDAS